MANFTETSLFKFFWTLILIGLLAGIAYKLFESARDSWKRTNGKWSSLVDEIFLGIVAIAVFAWACTLEPKAILNWVLGIVLFLINLVVEFLRQVGLPL